MDSSVKVELGFMQRRLPWIVAGVALVVYLATLNNSSTIAGITSLAKAAGWDWRANVVAPLHVILTYPVRWLPAGLQLFVLNLTAAVCAAATLGLLARSVALLPHDRTREQRAIERSDYSLLSFKSAWLPPVLAALMCGLQLSFWENAVVATGEALDILIFAWLVHALLAYRLDEKESRLSLFALVYGLGVTNNFALIGFFPAFLVAVVWIKGRHFFKWKFILRMLGCGTAGLALYLLLPLTESLSKDASYSFWELLRSYWGFQKHSLLTFPRWIALVSTLYSLLPVLFMGIRWPAQFGDTSAVGNLLTNLMTHLIHVIFLVACLYVVFDPAPSPRSLAIQSFQTSALLPFYYLAAVVIGYCSGYVLLIFGAKPGPQGWQRPSPLRKAAHTALVVLIWAASVALPCVLLFRNIPEIQSPGGKALDRLATLAAGSLPEQGAFVLSDDVVRLHALRRELKRSRLEQKYVLIDTASLAAGDYHRALAREFPNRWPKFESPPLPKSTVGTLGLVQLLHQLQQIGPVVYLQPSFGYYFEFFQMRPRKAVYEIKPCPTNTVSSPILSSAELKEQDEFWRSHVASDIEPVIRLSRPFTKPTKGKFRPPTFESYVGDAYSAAMNYLGVELQKAGALDKAGEYFDLAARLSPASPMAYANREFNGYLRSRKTPPSAMSDGLKDRIGALGGRWDYALSRNGPADEPNICYALARLLGEGRNFRQAAQLLERTIYFEPDNKSVRLTYMLMCVQALIPDAALQSIAAFKARFPTGSLTDAEQSELLRAEAWTHVVRNEVPKAEQILSDAWARFPQQSGPWETLLDIYLKLGRVTNAVSLLEKELQAHPNNTRALVGYAGVKIRTGEFAAAIALLDKALRQNPKDEDALLNRAIANFKLDRLDPAITDYETLRSTAKPAYQLQVTYELAEAYFRKKRAKDSLRLFKEFLDSAPPGTPEIMSAKDRIKLLESGAL